MKEKMREKAVSPEMARECGTPEWEKRTYCADPTYWDKGKKKKKRFINSHGFVILCYIFLR